MPRCFDMHTTWPNMSPRQQIRSKFYHASPEEFRLEHTALQQRVMPTKDRQEYDVQRLQAIISNPKVAPNLTQARYKHYIYKRIRKSKPVSEGCSVSVHVNGQESGKETLPHHVPSASRVFYIGKRTFTIQRGEVAESVSLYRLLIAPNHLTPSTPSLTKQPEVTCALRILKGTP